MGLTVFCAACSEDSTSEEPPNDALVLPPISQSDSEPCPSTGDPVDPPTSLKIATYNLQNLFDGFDDPAVQEGEFEPANGWNEAKAQVKLEHMARVIKDLNADIIGINEPENMTVFTALRDQIKDSGGPDYPYIALAKGKDGLARGIDVALMSRYPLLCSSVSNCPESCSRPINKTFTCQGEDGPLEVTAQLYTEAKPILETEVDFNHDGIGDMLFLVNHWKAKNEDSWPCVDSNENHRRAGMQLSELVDSFIQKDVTRPVFIMGDFNSYDFDPALTVDLQASLTLSDLTKANQIYNTWGERSDVSAAHTTNSNSWNNIENSSYYYDVTKEWSRLDHILVTANIRPNGGESPWRIKSGSTATYHPEYLLTSKKIPFEFKPSQSINDMGYSDHLAVYIEMERISN